MIDQRPPADGYRAISWPSEVREDAGRPPRLVGHFARFDTFNEIDSVREGKFMERIAPGAFKKTFAENRAIKVLFQHGRDPSVGEQPIAKVVELREDKHGPYYEAELLEGVPPLVMAGLREGVYGVSYRFSVDPARDEYNPSPGKSPANPKGLPERTIRQAWVYEFGPVTFPADAGADVAVRSLSDEMSDPPSEPVAPSLDAAAETPHLELERSDEPVTVVAIQKKESPKVDQYLTREEKASRATELKQALAREAIEYPGVLPADAQSRWDSDSAELEALERDIAAWDSRQARLAAYAQDEKKVERAYEPVASFTRKTEADIFDYEAVMSRSGSPEQRNQLLRDNAMRAVDQMRFPHPDVRPDEARAKVQALLDYKDTTDRELARRIIVGGSPLYYRAFNKLACGLPLTAEEQRGTALAMGVTTTGGYMVPAAFDPTLIPIGAWTSSNPVRAVCRVEQIVGSNVWHGLTSTAVTATRATEATVMVEQGPTLGQPSIQPTKVQGQITYSYETGEDRPDLGSEFARLMAEAKDTEEEAIFAHGVGDALAPLTNPIGVFANATGTVGAFTPLATTGDGAYAIGDVDRTFAALPLRHRSKAVWMMGREVLGTTQGFETTGGRLFGGTVGYPAVGEQRDDTTGNTGLRLLGRPVYESPSGKDIADLAGKPLLVLFDPTQYVIVDRVGMSVEFIPNLLSAGTILASGQRALVFHYRNSAKPVNVNGGRRLCYT
jgi:HK97 family phage major capsid protein/HK97 family phage prohead protease